MWHIVIEHLWVVWKSAQDCHSYLMGVTAVIFSRVFGTVRHFENKDGPDKPFSVSFNCSTRILQSRCCKIWTSSAVLKTLLQLVMMCCGLVAVMTWVMREPCSGVNKWGKWRKCISAKRKCLWTFIWVCLL